MAVGAITSPGGGAIGVGWNNGTVVSPSWTQSVQDDINQGLFNANARAIVVPAYRAIAYAAAGTLGGWSDAGISGGLGGGYLQTAAIGNYLIFPISDIVGMIPTGSYGQAWGLNSVSLRSKTSGASAATLTVISFSHQSSTAAVGIPNTTVASTSGTGDSFITCAMSSPPYVFDTDHLVYAMVTAGNNADKVYSITINFQNYGL